MAVPRYHSRFEVDAGGLATKIVVDQHDVVAVLSSYRLAGFVCWDVQPAPAAVGVLHPLLSLISLTAAHDRCSTYGPLLQLDDGFAEPDSDRREPGGPSLCVVDHGSLILPWNPFRLTFLPPVRLGRLPPVAALEALHYLMGSRLCYHLVHEPGYLLQDTVPPIPLSIHEG